MQCALRSPYRLIAVSPLMVQELNFQAFSDRLPPQNVDAEESILGGILLDPEAINRVADLLSPDAFYLSAHREIYRAALVLQGQGSPTDLMSVTSWLIDRGLLEKVGGQSKLAQLIDRTVSAVNIDQYAQLVMDKYMRRQLIKAGNEIAHLGHDTSTDLEAVLDQSEQKLFGVTQERPQQGLMAASDILTHTFSDIESRSLGMVLPGLSCGFYDLDAMTQGFQRSDLIIVAGRPSMGKCLEASSEILLSDGSVATIAELYQRQQAELLTLDQNWTFKFTQPSVFVDDGVKPVFRVKTRLGRTIETTLTHPYLTIEGWRSLAGLTVGDKIAVPRKVAVFGTKPVRDCAVKLLGYLIGDGSLTGINPAFINSNPQIQTEFIQCVTEFGDLTVRKETSNGKRTPCFYVSANLDVAAKRREQFGQRLQTLLLEKKITGRYLAQALDVSPSLVCSWQKGLCVPGLEILGQLCQILTVEQHDFFPEGVPAAHDRNTLTAWLREIGLWGKTAHTKTIPAFVFELPRSQLALFLNRLFATDGWASVLTSGQAQLGYATVSERLARQVQHLLLRFGVIAALKQRSVKYRGSDRTVWQIDITDARSIKTFSSDIGIFGKENALLKVQTALSTRNYQTNCDLIPVGILEQLHHAKGDEPWTTLARRAGIVGYTNLHVGKRALTRERLFTLATAIGDENLQRLATSDLYWDEIVSIEPMGEKQVYDLTIPDTHNFVANDICVHNTSFVMNIARNIAAFHKLPVAIFSLEMSKEQLVQRLLASEVRIESGRLRAGRVSQNEWEPLGHAISTLSQLPMFIDDTPNISITEMRSKARRLQAEQGGALGLILLDYLQLMEGGGDNRVQELSRITRALKGLARELSVPVIALSQLSRSVESRTNKRPMMSDLRECVTGDTLVVLSNGQRVPISQLVGQAPEVVSLDRTGKLVSAKADLVWKVGRKPIYEVKLVSGKTIRASANHRLYSLEGWQELKHLAPGDRLATARRLPEPSHTEEWSDLRVALLGQMIGDGSYLSGQPMRYTTASEENSQLVATAAVQEFGADVKRYEGVGNWHQLLISKNGNRWYPAGVNQWLRELGIFGQRSREKRVPIAAFSLSNRQLALLLRHLWATDGCISVRKQGRGGHRVFFSTVSAALATDVSALLLRLGILSTIRWEAACCFSVNVQGYDQQSRFLHQVGAFGPRVEMAALLRQKLEGLAANPNRDTIPRSVFDLVKAEMKLQNISQRQMANLRGTAYGGTAHFKFAPSRRVLGQYAAILDNPTLAEMAVSDIFWDQIKSIEAIGEADVYDLTVPDTASWLADGIVSHNSGAIEQDADLIMMLYRDEYYNPDTPDRGIAEVIISKHRNGPTGMVKLLFESQFTQFRNLAAPNRM